MRTHQLAQPAEARPAAAHLRASARARPRRWSNKTQRARAAHPPPDRRSCPACPTSTPCTRSAAPLRTLSPSLARPPACETGAANSRAPARAATGRAWRSPRRSPAPASAPAAALRCRASASPCRARSSSARCRCSVIRSTCASLRCCNSAPAAVLRASLCASLLLQIRKLRFIGRADRRAAPRSVAPVAAPAAPVDGRHCAAHRQRPRSTARQAPPRLALRSHRIARGAVRLSSSCGSVASCAATLVFASLELPRHVRDRLHELGRTLAKLGMLVQANVAGRQPAIRPALRAACGFRRSAGSRTRASPPRR